MFWIDFTANKLLKENIGTKLTEGEIYYLVRLLKHLYIMYSAPFFVNLGFIIMTNCNFEIGSSRKIGSMTMLSAHFIIVTIIM